MSRPGTPGGPPRQLPTLERLAELWNEASESEEADDAFFEAAIELLGAGELGPPQLQDVLEHVPEDDVEPFLIRLNRIAIEEMYAARDQSDETRICQVQLFAVPVFGDLARVSEIGAEIGRSIMEQLQPSGFVSGTSTAIVVPPPFAPAAVGAMHPQYAHDVRRACARMLFSRDFDGAASEELADLLALPEDHPARVVPPRGACFFLGAALTVGERGRELAFDSFVGVPGWAQRETPAARAMIETWRTAFPASDGYEIGLPIPLDEIGPELAEGLLVRKIADALAKEGVREHDAADAIDGVMFELRPDHVEIAALRGGSVVARLAVPGEAIGPYPDLLLERLEDSFDVAVRDEEFEARIKAPH